MDPLAEGMWDSMPVLRGAFGKSSILKVEIDHCKTMTASVLSWGCRSCGGWTGGLVASTTFHARIVVRSVKGRLSMCKPVIAKPSASALKHREDEGEL